MTFKELLEYKNITGYALSKGTGIAYTTINDLINGRTVIQNISLNHALIISKYLNVDIYKLARLESQSFVEFRYFRNNQLIELIKKGVQGYIDQVIRNKEIDYYYKNKGYKYAYYLLALIDYLCRINNLPIYNVRYNDLRKNKLNKPFFPGSNLVKFDTIEQAEKELHIKVIPEFGKYNIIEEDINNVA